jgi:NADP-dependent 3-hydroxy acid dehydrogenase YdfG
LILSSPVVYCQKNIIITGASSGIGAAVAVEYAKEGVVLGLSGRNKDRLTKVAEVCRSKGARVELLVVDVTESEKLASELASFDEKYPIDLIIANAGVVAATVRPDKIGASDLFVDVLRPITETNYLGVISTMEPLLRKFMNRRHGQIAIVSSIAG